MSAAMPTGMVPWMGGDGAPVDWDGGRVMYRNGIVAGVVVAHRWIKGFYEAADDIVAYTPKATLDTATTQAQPTPTNTPASEGGDTSTEAQAYRAIIVRIQEAAARYLPGELTKDEFINAVLEAVDGPEWREADSNERF